MTAETESLSFERVLDETCRRLWDVKVRYSLKRIGELEIFLAEMERELDAFLEHCSKSFGR